MTRKYFGTDGIRGLANQFPMTAEIAQKVAMAAAIVLKTHKTHARVVIGKDTRLSCYMLEQAMASGFLAMGMEVLFLGPIPTPAVAMLTRSMRADLGVMISASHNPYQDNGIKLFGSDGYKLSDDKELEIEALIEQDLQQQYADPDKIGRAKRLEDASGRYVEYVKNTFSKQATLEGMRIVVDCAHGAAYKVAPQVLWELGAKVIAMGVSPNGRNINDKCGATDLAALQARVVEEGAHIGIALDGDADRLIVVDEKGEIVDGDQLMGLVAARWKGQGRLSSDKVVATVMSNLGLERFLEKNGLLLERTAVGDRYVMEAMRAETISIGGEQSGHLIFSDYATSGDGLLAALQILSIIAGDERSVSEICHVFDPVPQVLKNVVYDRKKEMPLEKDEIKEALRGAETALETMNGRLLVRLSGTEPKIRLMAEGDDAQGVEDIIDGLKTKIEALSAA
ncbi:MAG: phosphoglucosamine mutase [Micavibrio sp.]|nr:phosphoglucosamine mutase [Micavibrio sp.]